MGRAWQAITRRTWWRGGGGGGPTLVTHWLVYWFFTILLKIIKINHTLVKHTIVQRTSVKVGGGIRGLKKYRKSPGLVPISQIILYTFEWLEFEFESGRV